MKIQSSQLKVLIRGLNDHYKHAEDTEKVIINCALVAAGADAVGGAIPVLAIPAFITSCIGAVWVMYGQLCTTLGISLKENALKLLARAALANIAANLGGVLLTSIAAMVVPGASIVVSAVMTFVVVYLAGIVFLRMILRMAEKSRDPRSFSDIDLEEMKKTIKKTKLTKEDLEGAKQAYTSHKEP